MSTSWSKDLPDVSTWVPRAVPDNVRSGLLLTCRAIEARIRAAAQVERSFNIDNYDAGLGIEDIVREELARMLPERYSVRAGVLNDSKGMTSGDHEVVVMNRIWAPAVKLGATLLSRRWHYPVEAAYAVVEVKQSLSTSSLDAAMSKLVSCSRLAREHVTYGQLTENMHITTHDSPGLILNPLATFVVAADLGKGESFEELAKRFLLINHQLDVDHKVHGLVALGHGCCYHGVDHPAGYVVSADFMRDRSQRLVGQLALTPTDSFYYLLALLLGHLNRSVLRLGGIIAAYGADPVAFRIDPATLAGGQS